jgi:hypothetical protein
MDFRDTGREVQRWWCSLPGKSDTDPSDPNRVTFTFVLHVSPIPCMKLAFKPILHLIGKAERNRERNAISGYRTQDWFLTTALTLRVRVLQRKMKRKHPFVYTALQFISSRIHLSWLHWRFCFNSHNAVFSPPPQFNYTLRSAPAPTVTAWPAAFWGLQMASQLWLCTGYWLGEGGYSST